MNAARKSVSENRPPSYAQEAVALSQVTLWQGVKPLIFDWSCIALTITAAVKISTWWAYALSLIVVASRQHALLVIVHEASHYRLSKTKWLNNLISNTFAAYPIFFCTDGYRANHMKHHRYLNSSQDPDWVRKTPLKEWQFPQKRSELMGSFLKIAATGWLKIILLFYALSGIGSKATYTQKESFVVLIQKMAFYCVAGLLLFKFDLWKVALLYWVVPFLLVFPMIERGRSIAEHFALPYRDEHSQSRNVICGPIEAFVFGPHNVRYHLTHHLYPSVPQYNLPKLHKLMLKNREYQEIAHENDAYFFGGKNSVLSDILAQSPKENS